MLTEKELQFVKDTPLYRFATSTPDGKPHVVPMITRMEGDNIVVGGMHFDVSYKRRLIDRNAWVACVWDTSEGDPGSIKGVEVRGKLVPTGKKWDDSEYFILTPTKIFSWGIEESPADSFRNKMNFDIEEREHESTKR